MDDIKRLTQRLLEFLKEREWEQFQNPKDCAMALSLEAAEVQEHFLWKNKEEIAAHIEKHKEAIGDELADVFYWVLLLSHDCGIDIVDALDKKIEKNAKKYPVEKFKGKHSRDPEVYGLKK